MEKGRGGAQHHVKPRAVAENNFRHPKTHGARLLMFDRRIFQRRVQVACALLTYRARVASDELAGAKK